jgi:hypothetical protein
MYSPSGGLGELPASGANATRATALVAWATSAADSAPLGSSGTVGSATSWASLHDEHSYICSRCTGSGSGRRAVGSTRMPTVHPGQAAGRRSGHARHVRPAHLPRSPPQPETWKLSRAPYVNLLQQLGVSTMSICESGGPAGGTSRNQSKTMSAGRGACESCAEEGACRRFTYAVFAALTLPIRSST